ncbi:MAG TPA: PqiC family protein [Opitutales bacterium]|nr:PqiC family protein [Opitutales bacterium]
MHRWHRRIRPITALALAGLAAGCSVLSPKPDLSHSYVLEPAPNKATPAPPPDPTLSLAVDYTEMPVYLDRPQMVARLSNHQPYIDEYHRWLEPLSAGFSRVLAQDIAQMADSTHVAAYPLPTAFSHDFEVHVTVTQFDGAPGGTVTLHAQWRISGPGGKPTYFSHDTTVTRPAAPGPDPAVAYVDALSRLVSDLAREIVLQMPEAHAAQSTLRR